MTNPKEVTITIPLVVANMAVRALYEVAKNEAGLSVAPFLMESGDLPEYKAGLCIEDALRQVR
jgi:hypothetical protein